MVENAFWVDVLSLNDHEGVVGLWRGWCGIGVAKAEVEVEA